MKRIKTIAIHLLLPALLLTGCSTEKLLEQGVGLLDKFFAGDNLAPIPSSSSPSAPEQDPAPAPAPTPAPPAAEEPGISDELKPVVPDSSSAEPLQTSEEPVQTQPDTSSSLLSASEKNVTPSHTDVTFFNAGESFRYLPVGVSGVYACEYSTGDDQVASVDSSTGTVTAVGPGTTKVKMHVESNGQYDFECIVRCNWTKEEKPAESSEKNNQDNKDQKDGKNEKPAQTSDKNKNDEEPVLPPEPAAQPDTSAGSSSPVTASHFDATFFNPKEHFKLTPIGAGDDYTSTYSSSDSAVAKVDQNGTVTAVAPGTATITMVVDCGGSDYTFECIVRCSW